MTKKPWLNTLHLKFANQQHADEVLSNYYNDIEVVIDNIGILYDQHQTDLIDENGFAIVNHEPKDGWHVNVRAKRELPELSFFSISVETPSRIFA